MLFLFSHLTHVQSTIPRVTDSKADVLADAGVRHELGSFLRYRGTFTAILIRS